MPKPKPVGPLLSKEPATELPAAALVQLNQAHNEALLAAERHAHARTKVQLIEAAARAQLADARAEVGSFHADVQACERRYLDLTADIKRTHNLTDKHAIDPLTGVVVLPEA